LANLTVVKAKTNSSNHNRTHFFVGLSLQGAFFIGKRYVAESKRNNGTLETYIAHFPDFYLSARNFK
jgi:hypothetical protein